MHFDTGKSRDVLCRAIVLQYGATRSSFVHGASPQPTACGGHVRLTLPEVVPEIDANQIARKTIQLFTPALCRSPRDTLVTIDARDTHDCRVDRDMTQH